MAYKRGQSGFLPDEGHPIEEKHLVAALRFAAYVVVRYGDKYVHTFKLLEEMLMEIHDKRYAVERAQKILDDSQ